MSERPHPSEPEVAWAGVHWGSPQVLLAFLACVAAAIYAVRSQPPTAPPAPELTVTADAREQVPRAETVLYAVDEAGLAHPVLLDLPAPEDRGARMQEVVNALRRELVESGAWPAELPAPHVHAFTLERRNVAVLDLRAEPVPLDVARERMVIDSIERTLLEQGVDEVAYLREGRSVRSWLGKLATAGGLD